MTDEERLVERLRSRSPYLDGSSAERTMMEAAEEIEQLNHYTERLRANAECDANEIERLKAALGPGATEAWEHMYDEIKRLKAGLTQIEKSYPRATTTALRRMARAILASEP